MDNSPITRYNTIIKTSSVEVQLEKRPLQWTSPTVAAMFGLLRLGLKLSHSVDLVPQYTPSSNPKHVGKSMMDVGRHPHA